MEKYLTFYRELANGEFPLTFQLFPDKAEDKANSETRRALTRILYGTPEKLWPTLTTLNGRGAGIFVCVNQMDGKWRSLNNLTAIQSYFVEIDGLDAAGKEETYGKFIEAVLPPSMVVDSRNGLHAYWLAYPGEDVATYREIEEGLIHAFGGDKQAKDAARVLRAPGFAHHKADPYLVTVLHTSDVRYTAGELAAEYPAPERPQQYNYGNAQPPSEPPSGAKLLALMDYCAALWTPGNRHEMALALAGKLYWWGVPETEALGIVRRVCELSGDPDPQDRYAAVRTTFRRAGAGAGVGTYTLKGLKF